MNEPKLGRIPKLPFLIGDLALVTVTIILVLGLPRPISETTVIISLVGFAIATCIGLAPYVLEYSLACKLSQTQVLADGFKKLQQLEAIANTINAATAQWFGVHDLAKQSLQAAKEVTDIITREAAAYRELVQKINESEKNLLKLEVEKLHRAQTEWVQTMIGIFDHIYALYKAAVKSGRPDVIEQIAKFQTACRDLALRVGLVPIEADRGDLFDPNQHAPADANANPQPGAIIAETIATGYYFQNKLVRPVIVNLEQPNQTPAKIDQTSLWQSDGSAEESPQSSSL